MALSFPVRGGLGGPLSVEAWGASSFAPLIFHSLLIGSFGKRLASPDSIGDTEPGGRNTRDQEELQLSPLVVPF